jgi:NAD+ synthase (glutamine-hydrolysing)
MVYNCVTLIDSSGIIFTYKKQNLPNYGVFDEKRYFNTLENKNSIIFKNHILNFRICEDLWVDKYNVEKNNANLPSQSVNIILNASPYEIGKFEKRLALVKDLSIKSNSTSIFCNMVGGQDELIFDGKSFVIGNDGNLLKVMEPFSEELYIFDTSVNNFNNIDEFTDINNEIYLGLRLSISDYFKKNNFNTAIIGLSGGIDSAVTAVLACDALGSENVTLVMMPSKFNSEESNLDAHELIKRLKCKFMLIDINDIFNNLLIPLKIDKHDYKNITFQNLQSRIRGLILMSLSNKNNSLVLVTGNKSELAVGYSTLYGDSAGAFGVLKDLSKTRVYQLANYINEKFELIPKRIINREPSAELAPDQLDRDALPDYKFIDKLIELFVEENKKIDDIIRELGNKKEIFSTLKMLKKNEFKRKQFPVGPKITKRAFGKDWRFPITNNFEID